MVWCLTKMIYGTAEATTNPPDLAEDLAAEQGVEVEVGALDVTTANLSVTLGGIKVARDRGGRDEWRRRDNYDQQKRYR
jgi:hypothetical protein